MSCSQKLINFPPKGTLKALEFRLDAILQANLDTFWLLICAILVFLMQAGFMCLESGLSRNKNSINVALKNVTDFGIAVVVFWAFGFALMYGTSVSGLFGNKFFFFTDKSCRAIRHTLSFKPCLLQQQQL
jgi:Amt family ammonium transporter